MAERDRLARWFMISLFVLAPLVDALTGFSVLSGRLPEGAAGSFSQVLRIVLLGCAFVISRPRNQFLALLLLLWLILLEVVWFLWHLNISGLVVGVVYASKIAFIAVVASALQRIMSKNGAMLVLRYFAVSAFLYASLTLIASATGTAFPTYDEGAFGTKGWFASGNGLSAYLGCAAVLLVGQKQLISKRWLHRSLVLMLILVCLAVATKASAVFATVLLIMFFMRLPLGLRALIASFMVALLVTYHEPVQQTLGSVFDVIIYRFNNSDSIWQFLASGRGDYVADALDTVDLSPPYTIRVITGAGEFLSFRNAYSMPTELDTLETDLFDIGFAYGLVGVSIYLFFIFAVASRLRSSGRSEFIAWICLAGYSVVAGHVVFNGMSSVVLALLAALSFQRRTGAAARRRPVSSETTASIQPAST